MRSGDKVVDDISVNVGEPEVAACVPVGQEFVIEAHEMEDGRMQVVHVNWILDGFEAELVGSSVDESSLGAAADQDSGEAVVVVVASADFQGRETGAL